MHDLEEINRQADDFIANADFKPCIGISANHKSIDSLTCIADAYVNAVQKAGGVPVIVPVLTDKDELFTIIDRLDGLLFSGGGDFDSTMVGEQPVPSVSGCDLLRDESDFTLLRLAVNRQLPIFGICRGHQAINLSFGGMNYQDLPSEHKGETLNHSQSAPRNERTHAVTLNAEHSIMSNIFGKQQTFNVNSFHHQAVKDVAPGFKATATASDGINEAMESLWKPIFSVQWHPEALVEDEKMLNIFRHLVKEASLFHKAKMLHNRILSIDTHTDTPMIFPGEFNIGKKEGGKVNLPLMEEGRLDGVIMAAYIPQGKRDSDSLQKATDFAIERLNMVKKQEKLNPTRMGIAYNPDDFHRLKDEGKKAIFLGVENGYAIGKDLDNINLFHKIGVCYITLCHNGDNDICDSARRSNNEWHGLSPFGKEVVRRMNDTGMIIDVSHAADSTFFDAIELSTKPIIASHSASRAICNHVRNLTDEQLKALAEKNGVCQVCMYKGFVNEDEDKASIDDVIRHITHVVEIAGIDHVGIGSDFDGDGEVLGCMAENEMINITMRLIKEGYKEDDIRKMWGGNFLRVMSEVQHIQ